MHVSLRFTLLMTRTHWSRVLSRNQIKPLTAFGLTSINTVRVGYHLWNVKGFGLLHLVNNQKNIHTYQSILWWKMLLLVCYERSGGRSIFKKTNNLINSLLSFCWCFIQGVFCHLHMISNNFKIPVRYCSFLYACMIYWKAV